MSKLELALRGAGPGVRKTIYALGGRPTLCLRRLLWGSQGSLRFSRSGVLPAFGLAGQFAADFNLSARNHKSWSAIAVSRFPFSVARSHPGVSVASILAPVDLPKMLREHLVDERQRSLRTAAQ
jgi:hypothetical protein